MSVVVLLPAEFAQRPNRVISRVEPAVVRQMHGFRKMLCRALLFLFAFPVIDIFWPAGVILAAIDIYYWTRTIWIFVKSYSRKTFEAPCPNCDRFVSFWNESGFICMDCRHLLMRHGYRLYDITARDVQALLESVPSNLSQFPAADRSRNA